MPTDSGLLWERFDVRSFLLAHLSEQAVAQVERVSISPVPPKVLSLVEMIKQAKQRLSSEKQDGAKG